MTELAKFVRSNRANFGLAQGEFAKKAGIPQSVLSRIESGRIKRPTLKTLSRLAMELDVSVKDLNEKIEEDKQGSKPPYINDDFFYAHSIENEMDGKAVFLSFTLKTEGLDKALRFFSHREFWINIASDGVPYPPKAFTLTVRLPWFDFHDGNFLKDFVEREVKAELGEMLLKHHLI